jgi:hypothetical protein
MLGSLSLASSLMTPNRQHHAVTLAYSVYRICAEETNRPRVRFQSVALGERGRPLQTRLNRHPSHRSKKHHVLQVWIDPRSIMFYRFGFRGRTAPSPLSCSTGLGLEVSGAYRSLASLVALSSVSHAMTAMIHQIGQRRIERKGA